MTVLCIATNLYGQVRVEKGDIVKNRLGTPDLHEKSLEPRVDDIGGNFSGVSNRGDTSGQKRS